MATLSFSTETPKSEVFEQTAAWLSGLEIGVIEVDEQRPWGGFFRIDTQDTDKFIDIFFPEVDKDDLYRFGKELGPKILLVEPGKRLSWQYHFRRAELWRPVLNDVGVKVSNTDQQPDTYEVLEEGTIVQHDDMVRHRLIGLGSWGVVAEIWQHSVEGNPSDEDDIVRLEDDFNRSSPTN